MIVCTCLSVSDQQIRDAVRKGTLGQLFRITKMGSECGTCIPEIRDVSGALQSCEQDPADEYDLGIDREQ